MTVWDLNFKNISHLALTGVAQLAKHCPQSERSQVGSILVRAHAWIVGQAPGQGVCKRQLIDVSLVHQCFPPSFSPSLPSL